MNSVAIDPNDVSSSISLEEEQGLYEFKDGSFIKEYTYENSPLRGSANVSATNKEYTLRASVLPLIIIPVYGVLIVEAPPTLHIRNRIKMMTWISHHKTSSNEQMEDTIRYA
jgi:hypothetical protein